MICEPNPSSTEGFRAGSERKKKHMENIAQYYQSDVLTLEFSLIR